MAMLSAPLWKASATKTLESNTTPTTPLSAERSKVKKVAQNATFWPFFNWAVLSAILSYLDRSERTSRNTNQTSVASMDIYHGFIINHFNSIYRTKIDALSAAGTHFRINAGNCS
jgi:hypothetical protein